MATASSIPVVQDSRKLIAPVWHTALLVAFLCIPLVSGYVLQHRNTAGNQVFASHSQVLWAFYIPALVYEWFLAFWVWIGLRMRGFTVKSLIGGRWNSRRSVFVDLALAVAVWIAMLLIGGVLSRILPPSTAKSTGVLMPQGALEFAIWIAVALTAGFVEELVCRGYLQTQLMRLGLPAAAAIFGQAVLFALGHIYEGMNAVAVITVYAILLGALALWRKSLRPGMVGHAWFDLAVVFLVRG